jgi:hypothetical protein
MTTAILPLTAPPNQTDLAGLPAHTCAALAARINEEHALALKSAESAIDHAIEAGRLLLRAREQIGRGAWLQWLSSNCTLTVRMSQRYMRVGANATRVSHSPSLRAALAELAAPRPAKPEPESTFPAPQIPICVQSGCITVGLLDGKPAIIFEESHRHPGFWYCHDFRDGTVNTRPIRADAAGYLLNGVPHSALCEWHLCDGPPKCFAEYEAA